MPASAAAAERVFSAQPIVQETESARGTDEKDKVYGGFGLGQIKTKFNDHNRTLESA